MTARTAPLRFITRPSCVPDGARHLRLVTALVVADGPITRTVPAGFRFDGASVPRPLWWLVGHPFTPRYWYPAALHDHDIARRAEPSPVVHARLGRALSAAGVQPRTARCFAWAARVFGPRWSVAPSPLPQP